MIIVADPQEILNEYQEKMKEYKQQAEEINQQLEDGSIARNAAQEQKQGVLQEARAEQGNYKEQYKKAIDSQINEVKEQVANSELPGSIASLDSINDVSKTELEILAEKHQDNYFAQKKLAEVARDNDLLVNTNEFDAGEKIGTLKQQKEQAHRKFNSDPLKDTPDGRLRRTMGLDRK